VQRWWRVARAGSAWIGLLATERAMIRAHHELISHRG
jgi:hypothetical protein